MANCDSTGSFEALAASQQGEVWALQPDMPEITPIGITDHGRHFAGRLLVDDTVMRFRQESPHEPDGSPYYFLTGFGGSKESMAVARCAAVHDGSTAFASAAAQNHFDRALLRDADEFTSLVNNTEFDEPKNVVALSMGSAITALAARDLQGVEIITMLGAGIAVNTSTKGMITNALDAVANRVIAAARDPWGQAKARVEEIKSLASRPLAIPLVGIQGIQHNFGRIHGMTGERHDLADPVMQAIVQEALKTLIDQPNRPFLRLVIPIGDMVINQRDLIRVGEEIGVDEIVPYKGAFPSHVGSTHHDGQTKFILDLDRAHTGQRRSKHHGRRYQAVSSRKAA